MSNFLSLMIMLRIEDYMLPCFSKRIFDVDCPGCGLQRGLVFLLKGDFAAAWGMYPALFAMIPLFGFLAANHFFNFKHANKISITLMILSVGLILMNYISKLI